MLIVDAISEGGKLLVDDLRASQRRKGLNASGRTAASARFEVTDQRSITRLRILGSRIFRILQNGRGPNRSGKPSREQIDGLTEWVKLRGIPVAAVWAIATKQARYGTIVPNRNNPGGVLSQPLSKPNVVERLKPALRSAALDEVRTQLFRP